jgi:hypothetical protein
MIEQPQLDLSEGRESFVDAAWLFSSMSQSAGEHPILQQPLLLGKLSLLGYPIELE